MERINKIIMVVLGILMIQIVIVIGILIYNLVSGCPCPVCGGTEWIGTGEIHTIIINNCPHKVEEMICANCGHIL